MREAVIVSTARTPLTKAARGAFNNTTGATLGGWSIRAAVERAGIEGGEVDDVLMGTAVQQGSTGGNVGRLAALRRVGQLHRRFAARQHVEPEEEPAVAVLVGVVMAVRILLAQAKPATTHQTLGETQP